MSLLFWALDDIQQTQICGGFTIVTTTDVACHQWLRHTLKPPQKHPKPVERRGLIMSWDARFCFVAFEDLEQNEAGDTFTHTFTWTGWVDCMTRWFYFWATHEGDKMNSTSCIFSKHFTFGIPPLTFHIYPDPHPEVTSVDGRVRRAGLQQTWAQIRDGAGTLAVDSDPGTWVGLASHTDPDRWLNLDRSIFLFDTSVILPEYTILSATLHLFGKGKGDGFPCLPAVNIFASNPASNIALVPADYQSLGMTLLSTEIGYNAFLVGAYNHFPLNAAGLALIVKGGITKLGARESKYDVPNSPPPWVISKASSLSISTSEDAESEWPDLEVTILC